MEFPKRYQYSTPQIQIDTSGQQALASALRGQAQVSLQKDIFTTEAVGKVASTVIGGAIQIAGMVKKSEEEKRQVRTQEAIDRFSADTAIFRQTGDMDGLMQFVQEHGSDYYDQIAENNSQWGFQPFEDPAVRWEDIPPEQKQAALLKAKNGVPTRSEAVWNSVMSKSIQQTADVQTQVVRKQTSTNIEAIMADREAAEETKYAAATQELLKNSQFFNPVERLGIATQILTQSTAMRSVKATRAAGFEINNEDDVEQIISQIMADPGTVTRMKQIAESTVGTVDDEALFNEKMVGTALESQLRAQYNIERRQQAFEFLNPQEVRTTTVRELASTQDPFTANMLIGKRADEVITGKNATIDRLEKMALSKDGDVRSLVDAIRNLGGYRNPWGDGGKDENIYQTDAIGDAIAKGNPAALSVKDRAVFDSPDATFSYLKSIADAKVAAKVLPRQTADAQLEVMKKQYFAYQNQQGNILLLDGQNNKVEVDGRLFIDLRDSSMASTGNIIPYLNTLLDTATPTQWTQSMKSWINNPDVKAALQLNENSEKFITAINDIRNNLVTSQTKGHNVLVKRDKVVENIFTQVSRIIGIDVTGSPVQSLQRGGQTQPLRVQDPKYTQPLYADVPTVDANGNLDLKPGDNVTIQELFKRGYDATIIKARNDKSILAKSGANVGIIGNIASPNVFQNADVEEAAREIATTINAGRKVSDPVVFDRLIQALVPAANGFTKTNDTSSFLYKAGQNPLQRGEYQDKVDALMKENDWIMGAEDLKKMGVNYGGQTGIIAAAMKIGEYSQEGYKGIVSVLLPSADPKNPNAIQRLTFPVLIDPAAAPRQANGQVDNSYVPGLKYRIVYNSNGRSNVILTTFPTSGGPTQKDTAVVFSTGSPALLSGEKKDFSELLVLLRAARFKPEGAQ